MTAKLRNWWPAALCELCYLLVVIGVAVSSTGATGGRIVYPLDDTYIHMAIAKNFATRGVWGVSGDAFSSSTSSPLYTALLAAGDVAFGVRDLLPLVVNLLFGTVLIGALFRRLRREVSPRMVLPLLLFITAALSLPGLTLLGMEHVLHTLLTILFVHLAATALADTQRGLRQARALLLAAALLPITRYEGLLAVALVVAFLLLQRRFTLAVGVALAGLTPVAAYGLLALSHGWLLIPNSVLLKGSVPDFSSVRAVAMALGGRAVLQLLKNPSLLILLIAGLVACVSIGRSAAPKEPGRAWWEVVIFLGLMLLHLQTARVGWLFRYDAYLVGLGLLVSLPTLLRMLALTRDAIPARTRRLRLGIPLLGLLPLAVPFAQRAVRAVDYTRQASYDRYLEHILPARFLAEYRPDATIAVNDIGAIAYYTRCRVLDVYGLGSMEPLRFRRSDSGYTRDQVREWARQSGATLAVLQIQWAEIARRIPEGWVEVAVWELPRNVVFGDTRIGWFALKPELAPSLARDLTAFQAELPADIQVTRLIAPASPQGAADSP